MAKVGVRHKYSSTGDVVKLVDTLDLGSSAARRGSSSLPVPTIKSDSIHSNYKKLQFLEEKAQEDRLAVIFRDLRV